MIQSTASDRSTAVNPTQKAAKRSTVAAESASGYYRGRDRVVDIAVRNADRDGVRRCKCPDCCRRRGENTPMAVAR
jgi:hypothetical protein